MTIKTKYSCLCGVARIKNVKLTFIDILEHIVISIIILMQILYILSVDEA